MAHDEKIIGNAGALTIPEGIPTEYEFEILRLRRRIESLECSVRERDERNLRAIIMLEDELQMWRTFFHDHVSETHDGISRRIVRLNATLMTLRDDNQSFSAVQISKRWRKR